MEDVERTRRSGKTVKEVNVTDLRKMLENDRKMTYHQIEEILNIQTIRSILQDNMRVKNLCFFWMPHCLTEDVWEQNSYRSD